MGAGEWFRSVEAVWALWLGSAATLAALLTRKPGRPARELAGDESGSTYVLSFVMIFPLYIALIGLVIETTLILIAKTGTVYAAYAGARSRAVWDSAAPELVEVKVRQATARALAPFASGSREHLEAARATAGPEGLLVGAAYRAHGGTADPSSVAAQHAYAAAATEVALPAPGAPVDGVVDLSARLTYQKPLYVPVIARMLGRRAPWPGAKFRTYAITTEVALPDEAPRNEARSLGIGYSSR